MINYEYSSSPETISWDVTLKCNLKCKHCYSSSGYNNIYEELNTEEAFKLIDDMKEIGVFQLILLGGEPLLRKDIFDIIEYAKLSNIDVALSTNGTLINSKIAKKLSKFNLHGVQISLDSSTEEKHDNFRQVSGVFKSAINAIGVLSKYGNRVVVNTVISKINIKEIEEIIKLALNYGANEFRCIKYLPVGRGVKEFNCYAIDKEENIHLKENLKFLKQKYKGKITVSIDESMSFLDGNEKLFCTAGITTCSIKSNGDVTPCSYINSSKYICGNVKRDSIKVIWNRNMMRDFRNIEYIEGKCKKCEYLKQCKGGCKAAALGLYGNHNLPDPYCYVE